MDLNSALDLGPHATFIIISYLGVALVSFALIVGTILSSKHQKKRLADLEAKGIRRKSDK